MPRKSSRINYKKLVPQDTFLWNYLAYMEAQECPYAYDFWTACWLLSVAVGRHTVVNRPRAPVYLNLFAILVADSGITRKSSAVRAATKFARGISDNPTPYLIETKMTPEHMLGRLAEQTKQHGTAHIAISVSELVTFLGKEKYVEQMPTLLTDLYDSPDIRTGGGTISGGTQRLENVYVSFLSASTPSWLIRAVNPDVIEGGFTSRVLFIVEEKPKRLNSWPEELDGNADLQLRTQLAGIRERALQVNTIEINDGGRKAFDKWYRGRTLHRDVFRSSFQSREDAHILRLAAFLCINDGLWCIQSSHITTAIKVVEQLREDGASIFEGTGSNSRLILGIDKLRDKLLAAGQSGIPQRDLTKAVQNFINAEHMGAALDIMHSLGMVQKFEGIQIGRGRPTTLWRATSALVEGKALDKIIEAHQPG